MNITFTPTVKQDKTWEYLHDTTTVSVLYGGSAGSGKSFLGCMWLITNCLVYPKTRWLMGRARLNILKRTTLKTFIDICSDFKIQYKINI